MALLFPNSPTNGQESTQANGVKYIYNAAKARWEGEQGSAIGKLTMEEFISPQIPLAKVTPAEEWAHGLSATPVPIVHMVNIIAEYGYAEGDVVVWNPMQRSSTSAANDGVTVFANALNVGIMFGDDIRIYAKDNGAQQTVTEANWRVVIVARIFTQA